MTTSGSKPGWTLRLASGLVCLWTAACGPSDQEGGSGRPNLLLISIDTTRADHLGCYGAPADRTPTLDRLAAEGVLFERAYTPVPFTLPAHTSLMTGEWPFVHGVRTNGQGRVPDQALTLAEVLQEAGYRTAGFPAAPVVRSQEGLAQGFDTYLDRVEQEGELYPERTGRQTQALFREWLDDSSEAPFFAWLHFFEPHQPFTPPADLKGRFGSPYAAEIHEVDRVLAGILDDLQQRGLRDDTWVCVVSDHGEGLNDHGELTHGIFLYESTTHVPWILWHADAVARRVPDVVSLVDVMPTLLGLAGLPPVPCSGRDYSPLLRGETGQIQEQPAYLESYVGWLQYGWSPQEGLVTERWKYLDAPRRELFQLIDDPDELRNRASEDPEATARWQQTLERMRSQVSRRLPLDLVTLGDSARQDLEALGYVTGGASAPTADMPRPGEEDLADAKDRLSLIPLLDQLVLTGAKGQGNELLSLARQVLAQEPDNPHALHSLGVELTRQGQFEQALPVLVKLEEMGRSSPRSLLSLGMCLLKTGEPGPAAVVLREGARLDPGLWRTRFWLAEAEAELDHKDEARRLYQELLNDFDGPDGARQVLENRLRELDPDH